MANKIGGDGDKQLSKTQTNTISETQVGSQQETEPKDLLQTITDKYPIRFRHIPILGTIHGSYRKYSIKTEYIKTLEQTFVAQATSNVNLAAKAISPEEASSIYNKFIKNHLSNKSSEEIKHFEKFIKNKAAAAFFCTIIPKNQNFKDAVQQAILVQQKFPEKCQTLCDTFNRMCTLCVTLDSESQNSLFNDLLGQLANQVMGQASTIDKALHHLTTFAEFLETNDSLHHHIAIKMDEEKLKIIDSVLRGENLIEDLRKTNAQPEELGKILDSKIGFPSKGA